MPFPADRPSADPVRSLPKLIFDGDCGFCTSSASWVARRLARHDGTDAVLAPWQFTDLSAIGTTSERTQREVLWVGPDGEIRGGASAVAAWLRYRGGPLSALGVAMELWGVRVVAAAVYRLIARNRQRLPGGSPACALPPPGSRAPTSETSGQRTPPIG